MKAFVEQECLFVFGVVGIFRVVYQLFFAFFEGSLNDQLVVKVGTGSANCGLGIFEASHRQLHIRKLIWKLGITHMHSL